ncbi:MAG: hypothetical protein AAFV53_32320 [Myxococcota bacterium]
MSDIDFFENMVCNFLSDQNWMGDLFRSRMAEDRPGEVELVKSALDRARRGEITMVQFNRWTELDLETDHEYRRYIDQLDAFLFAGGAAPTTLVDG